MENIDKAKIKIERTNKFLLVRYYKLYKEHKNIIYNNCGYDEYLTDRDKKYVNNDHGGWRRKFLHTCLLRWYKEKWLHRKKKHPQN